jgi:O-antigen/teichoic acid export membrane protein
LRRFFVRNVFFLLLVNLVVKPLWIFGVDRKVHIAVGDERYGQYFILLNFSLIFQILLDMGLQNYNSRTIARSPQTLQGLFPNIMVAKLILSVVYLLLLSSLAYFLGYHGNEFWLLLMLSLVQIFQSFLLYLRSNIAAMHRFTTDSLLSVADRFIMILVCSLLLWHPLWSDRFRIEWFVYAQMAAYLLTAGAAFFICIKMAPFRWRQVNLGKVWLIGRQSLPYAMLVFLMSIYIRVDSFLIERLLPQGTSEAGIYASASRFLDISNNVTGVLFAGMLLPIFGRMLAGREDVAPLARLAVNLLLSVAFVAVAAVLIYNEPIMRLALGDMTSAYRAQVFAVAMIAFPGYCIGYVYATLLTANGNLRVLVLLSLSAVLVNLIINLILIPKYGALGAAVAGVATQLFLSVANILLAQRILRLKGTGRWPLQYGAFLLILGSTAALVLYVNLSLWSGLVFLTLSGILGMLLCGFLPVGKILQLLKSR